MDDIEDTLLDKIIDIIEKCKYNSDKECETFDKFKVDDSDLSVYDPMVANIDLSMKYIFLLFGVDLTLNKYKEHIVDRAFYKVLDAYCKEDCTDLNTYASEAADFFELSSKLLLLVDTADSPELNLVVDLYEKFADKHIILDFEDNRDYYLTY